MLMHDLFNYVFKGGGGVSWYKACKHVQYIRNLHFCIDFNKNI